VERGVAGNRMGSFQGLEEEDRLEEGEVECLSLKWDSKGR